ncbi:exo-alpha-sialidase [Paenibacillus sp. LjRoot153]|uniref:exo-alpha-sialidase n=1 Tax=Paenibacillus sp. LjRoot153 TaxID=3342270 RepID=UPI003ECECC68
MLKKSILFVFIIVLVLVQIPASLAGGVGSQVANASTETGPYFHNMDLYVAGTEGYNTFRIPSLLTTKAGTLLAFVEGRKNSAADNGNIDLVLKRSLDQGRTWQPLQIVCDAGVDTCGNPTPVQDETTGRIWLFVSQNYSADTYATIVGGTSRGVRTIWSTYSDDDGATWTQPVNHFSEVQAPNTRWDGTGPGIGIQLRQGAAKGRLVIPAIDRNIQSDDHGATWYESGKLPSGLGEPTVVELTDGTLMRNDRLSSNQEIRRRGISTSPDQGATWSPISYDNALIDPICEASIIRYMPSDNVTSNRMLLFSNPADTVRREKMTVRISNDDGQSWATSKTVYKGPSAYSSLAILPDGKVSLLFEGGEYTPYDKIMFAVFNLEWFQAAEPDLDNILFSDGSMTPMFRGDISDYLLTLYSGTEQLTITPVTSNKTIAISVNGEPAAAGIPKTILLGDLQAISIEAKLGQRVRQYNLHLDRTSAKPELLMHWDFDQSDATGISDLTGKGHTGVMSSGAELRPGLDGNALYLNGTRANVEITNEEDLHPGTDNFTFSVWVNPEALFQPMHVLYWYGKAGSKVPQWWFAVHNTGAVRMNMAGLPSGKEVGLATQAGLVKTGVWTYLTAVRDGSVNKIYVNGELAATSAKFDIPTMNVTNPSAPPLVGYDKGAVANRDWKGYMDELQIYKYAMNEADVRKHYLGIDKAKPVTQAAVVPGEPNGANGWYTSDVAVTLSANDDFSGVARTEYRLNSQEWKAYEGTFAVSTEGTNLLEYRSVDRAGNMEDSLSKTLRIDKKAPMLNIVPDKTELWPSNGKLVPIQVDIQAVDDISGVAEIKLISIISNETDGKKGKADGEADIQGAEYGTDDRTFLLRAERDGGGSGRIYTIEYTVTDQAGHVTSKTANVLVKHDQSY